MPVLASLSLLSTAASGLLQVAGEVADALHSAKAGSAKKSDSPNQSQGTEQLVNIFAAYLAAAANPAASPTTPATPSANVPIKGAPKSIKEVSASLAPLSVVLAVGPATAITASMALRAAPVGTKPTSSKTAYPLAPAKGTVSTAPTATNALHPTAKQPSASSAKTPSPSTATQKLRITSLSERIGSSTTAKLAAPEVVPASHAQTTKETPVLALHDVPAPTVQDSPQSAVASSVSRSTHTEPQHAPTSPGAEALAHGTWAHGETLEVPEVSWRVQAAHPTATARDHSPQQADLPQPAANPLVIAAGSVSQTSGTATAAGSKAPQTNVPVAEQISRALVAQVSTVTHIGRTDFHLRLEPPHLGSVQIHLTATDHTVSARVVVAQEGTRQLIQGQAHQLRQSLAESGLVLGNFDVTRDGGGFSQSGHHQPPELPPPPTEARSALATAIPAVNVKTSRIVPSDGINILA